MHEGKKLILIDDHAMVLQGLKSWFSEHSDWTVVGTAGTVKDAITLIDSLSGESCGAVIDLSLSGAEGDGYDILRHITQRAPNALPVVYSSFCGGGYVTTAMRLGARAFVSKGAGESALLQAIECASGGKIFIQGELVGDMLTVRDMYAALTNRELDLIDLLAKGLSKEQVAGEMGITLRTVENYLSRLYEKTYTTNKIELLERLGRRFF